MKKIILSLAVLLVSIIAVHQFDVNAMDDNQTTLYYMYSNEEGHYFLDPSSEYENVIYVSLDDLYLDDTIHHGNKFIGTFSDSDLWELVSIEKLIK